MTNVKPKATSSRNAKKTAKYTDDFMEDDDDDYNIDDDDDDWAD